MSHANWCDPIVIEGVLGWGNRKFGCEAYGPGGRWLNRRTATGEAEVGDLLGDALERAGGTEGMPLVVVAVDRFAGGDEVMASLRGAIQQTVNVWMEHARREGWTA